MSYNIEYNPELYYRYPLENKKRISFPWKLFAVLILCAMTGWLFAQSELLRFFVPGDPDITVEAFAEMVEKIDGGVSVGEGILSFCEDVIRNAQ